MKRYILIFGWLIHKRQTKIKTASADLNAGMETKFWRLVDVVRSTETVLRGQEVILKIWRLWCLFAGLMAHHLPRCESKSQRNHFLFVYYHFDFFCNVYFYDFKNLHIHLPPLHTLNVLPLDSLFWSPPTTCYSIQIWQTGLISSHSLL